MKKTSKYDTILRSFIDWSFKNWSYILISIIILVFITLFFNMIKQAVIISLLIIIGGISKIYQRYMHAPIGVELVMFSTVISGYVYGPLVGGFVGFASFALATYYSVRYTAYVIPSFAIYILSGMLSSLFESVTVSGIIFSIIFVLILSYVSIAFLRSRLHRVAMFAFTSFLWNIWVFSALAPRVVSLLS